MNSEAMVKIDPGAIIEQVIAMGDLSKLTPKERTEYYKTVCESIGLNPLTKPFEYINLNGKLTLYARKDATDQLRKIHGVSIRIAARERIEDVYLVTARATDSQGREDESIGAVSVRGLHGDALCNAIMKAETKSKRRVTLSICGLGMLDESEIETIREINDPNTTPDPERNGEDKGSDGKLKLVGKAAQIDALRKSLNWTEENLIQVIVEEFKTKHEGNLPDLLLQLSDAELGMIINLLKAEVRQKSNR